MNNLAQGLLGRINAPALNRPQWIEEGGQYYQPVWGSNASGEAGQGQEGGLQQIVSYDPNKTAVGDAYNMYDPTGQYTGQGQFKKVKDGDLMAMGLLAAVSMGTLLPGVTAAGAYTPAMYGPLAGAVGPGAALGAEAAAPGIFNAALDSQLANASINAAGGNALAGYSSTMGLPTASPLATGALEAATPGLFNAAADSQLANLAIQEAGGNALAGYSSMYGLPTTSPIAPGFLDTLANGAKSLLGPLASKTGMGLATTALGGLLGSKGEQAEGTKTTKLDPRLDALVYGDGGVLTQANKYMKQQLASDGINDLQRLGMQRTQDWLTSPAYSQGFQRMQNLGMGLLDRGIAPNPFNKNGV